MESAREFEQAVKLVESVSVDPKSISSDDFEQALRILILVCLRDCRGVSLRGIDGASDWLEFEMEIWNFAESLRMLCKANRKIRGRGSLMDYVAELVCDSQLGKGRQNLILVLAQYGGSEYVKNIASLLFDADVQGHVVQALFKLKAPGYSEEIATVAQSTRYSWVRAAAKKYKQAFGGK